MKNQITVSFYKTDPISDLDKIYIKGSTMFPFMPNEYMRKRELLC